MRCQPTDARTISPRGRNLFLKSNNYPSPQFSTGEICMGGKLLCAANPNTWPGGIFFEIRHLSITPNFPQCQTISPQRKPFWWTKNYFSNKSIITLIQFQRAFTSEYVQGRKYSANLSIPRPGEKPSGSQKPNHYPPLQLSFNLQPSGGQNQTIIHQFN